MDSDMRLWEGMGFLSLRPFDIIALTETTCTDKSKPGA